MTLRSRLLTQQQPHSMLKRLKTSKTAREIDGTPMCWMSGRKPKRMIKEHANPKSRVQMEQALGGTTFVQGSATIQRGALPEVNASTFQLL